MNDEDRAVFAEVTAEAPAALEAPEVAAPVTEVAKPAAPVVEQEQRVPLHELLSERRTRQALEREIEGLRKPVEPVKRTDLFENPSQFVREEMDQGLQRDRQAAVYNSRLIAEARFGEKDVTTAMEAFDGLARSGQMSALENRRVMESPNPFAEAVKWHQEHQVRTTVGTDLKAYRDKVKAELLADAEFRKEADAVWRAQAGGVSPNGIIKPAVVSTPSLARVGAAALPTGANDQTDEELFSNITARRRKT